MFGEGTTLNNIALIYDAQNNFTEGLESWKQALTIRKDIGDKAGETETRWNIGVTYAKTGDFAQAEQYIHRAVRFAESIDHPDVEKYREGLKQVRAERRGA